MKANFVLVELIKKDDHVTCIVREPKTSEVIDMCQSADIVSVLEALV